MSIAQKIAWSLATIFVGAVLFGVIRETVGHGQYLLTMVEGLVLLFIWSQRAPKQNQADYRDQVIDKPRQYMGGGRTPPRGTSKRSHERPLPRIGSEGASVTPPLGFEEEPSSWRGRYKEAFIAIEYRPGADEAWDELKTLPAEYREKFLEKLNAEPRGDISKAKSEVALEYEKYLKPFDDDEMNQALAEARQLGSEAEKEFLSVAKTLGDSVSVTHLIEKIRIKYKKMETVGVDVIERGMIGNREYYIKKNGKVYVQNILPGAAELYKTFWEYSTFEEARRVLKIPEDVRKKIIE